MATEKVILRCWKIDGEYEGDLVDGVANGKGKWVYCFGDGKPN
jgi:hypothetical protein